MSSKTNIYAEFLPEPYLSYNNQEEIIGLRKMLKLKSKQIIYDDVENIKFLKLSNKEIS